MSKREDGRETRLRLLNAACEVFAKNGYHDAKVADICRRADANVAAVNYYFGDKTRLYREAWQHALKNTSGLDIDTSSAVSSQDRLRKYIETLIKNFATQGKLGQFSRLYLMEMVNPTGIIQEAWHDIIEPRRQKLHAIIKDIIGAEADDLDIRFCELSIINQCRALITIKNSDLEYMLGCSLTQERITQLANHIADFSLAGIQGVGRPPKK